jgi:hypothetical protein
MTQAHIAVLLNDVQLTLDELSISCAVSCEWIVEHVRTGVLLAEPPPDPGRWSSAARMCCARPVCMALKGILTPTWNWKGALNRFTIQFEERMSLT